MTGQIEPATPVIRDKERLSAIWFLPLLALFLGGWLLFQHLNNSATEIRIHFDNANSILVGKTRIKYQGVDIGKVTDIKLDEDISGVYVVAEIEKQAAHMLKSDTQFWLVKAKASLTGGISGLDTLFSGSYINMRPGVGVPASDFIASEEQPLTQPERGLVVKLLADDMGSVSIGSPVYYKKIQVGEVYNFRLVRDAQQVEIQLNIQSKYANLVKQNSRFWNVSGINAEFSFSGLKVHTESLASIISGAISFDSPAEGNKAPSNFLFKLYNDVSAADRGAKVLLKLENISGIGLGTPIIYRGFKAGKITHLDFDNEQNLFLANAVIEPMFKHQLSNKSRFWLERANIGLGEIKNLGNLIKGDYIGFQPETGEPMRTFLVSDGDFNIANGLGITIVADDAAGISTGDPLYYRRLTVGKITSIKLNPSADGVMVNAVVNPRFKHLIGANSRFYLSSGIAVKASLEGLQINAEPLSSFISGGISFYNTNNKATGKPLNKYRLYPDKSLAQLGQTAFATPLTVKLLSDTMTSVTLGSPVYFRKLPVGKVSHYDLTRDGKILIKLSILGQYRHLIKSNSVFWDVSGLDIKAGLSGVEVQADSLMAIAAGGIAFDNIADKSTKQGAYYPLFESFQAATEIKHTLALTLARADGLKTNALVKYKGLTIGEITQLSLDQRTDNVTAKVALKSQYADRFLRQGSEFWLVNADLSLKGAKHLDTVITGPYIEAVPGSGKRQTRFSVNASAPIVDRKASGLALVLKAPRAGSLSLGSPVYFRQVEVGKVTDFNIAYGGDAVEVHINIEPKFQHLVRTNTVFWQASGFNMDIGITGASLKAESLEAILSGGISFATPDGRVQGKAKPGQTFKLEQEFDDKWLSWQPKIPR
ncbi:MlaD family protein [Motilimonas eburnea]|uniref:MlaD family protein n=1 Tax=Motilimonas eburnea TaxID=1737488 RepID=UPI001E5A6D08|nr:MlaD family protein [Motilimonas eburnea]MCE2570340.1 MlaD family protein [Motilimonas eburnea]